MRKCGGAVSGNSVGLTSSRSSSRFSRRCSLRYHPLLRQVEMKIPAASWRADASEPILLLRLGMRHSLQSPVVARLRASPRLCCISLTLLRSFWGGLLNAEHRTGAATTKRPESDGQDLRPIGAQRGSLTNASAARLTQTAEKVTVPVSTTAMPAAVIQITHRASADWDSAASPSGSPNSRPFAAEPERTTVEPAFAERSANFAFHVQHLHLGSVELPLNR
jgi:hypothetical protein